MKTQKSYRWSLFRNIVSLFIFLTMTYSVFGLKEALGEHGIDAYAIHQKEISGAGVNIGLLSVGNVRAGHIAFERTFGSAVKNYDFTGDSLSRSSHDTHMAEIILSAGSPTHPNQIGVAPGASLHSARFSNKQLYPSKVTQALDTLVKNHNCRIIMTGIQLPKEIVIANGNSGWAKLYDYYAETYDVIFASAAGNSSPLVTVFGDIHNGITTAGMVKSDPNGIYDKIGSISNHGPTADGRKKPEIAAPTQGLVVPTSSGDDQWSTLDEKALGLTSYAVPHTAGVAALLLEAAAKSPVENDNKSEVIKAVIINAADPIESGTKSLLKNPTDSITHWQPDSGYGKLNALNSYETLMAGPVVQNTPSQQNKGWAYGIMDKNQTHEYQIQGEKGQRLVVTITWHRKLQNIGKQYFQEPIRFYLDLKILSPTDKLVVFESAGANNLIKVDHYLTEEGLYTLALKNPTLVKDRDYGMAFEVIDTPENPS